MAKAKSFVIEDEVVFMDDVKVEFVSLVGHAANRQPFQVIKGDKDMKKVIDSVLVPKEMDEEKIKELSKKHQFSLDEKQEDVLDGFDLYKQVSDEDIDEDTKNVAVIEKEDGIYGILADPKDKRKGTEKQFDEADMDSIIDGMFAMSDVVIGTLRQPQASDANRKNNILQAIDNFRKHAEAVLSNTKEDDVIDLENYEVKGENLEPLFKTEQPSEPVGDDKEEDSKKVDTKISEAIEALKSELELQVDEKLETKFKEASDKIDSLGSEIDTNLNKEFETVASKEEKEAIEGEVKELKDSIEELKNKTQQRHSEPEEDVHKKTEKKDFSKKRNFVTFA